MPRTADKHDIPNRLTQAGYEIFSRLGYNATGIQQITEQAGVPKGSFYNHFDSKESFAVVIIRQYAEWINGAWQTCVDEAPVRSEADALGVLRYVFDRFIRHHEQAACPGCLVGNFAAEVAESSDMCRVVLDEALHHWRLRLATLIELAQQQGQVRSDCAPMVLSALVWDAWEGALLRMKVEHRSQPLKDTIHLLFNSLLRP